MEKRNPYVLLKFGQPLWKALWQFLKNLKIELPYDPDILNLSIYPKELKSESWEISTTICNSQSIKAT